ncbi:MAG: YqgE/AlgH family protein [Actinomycetota bacterium]|nr:YqgE/AlgH family protein [Actinomycetota bacterium]
MAAEESLQGQVLIASPSIFDPNFRQAVVLIAQHDETGAMGVILNRPTQAKVRSLAPALERLTGLDDVVYAGGPVDETSLIVLAEFDEPDAAALMVLDHVGFVAVGTDLDEVAGITRRARTFAGHSGWAPGQLETEMEREDWITEAAVYDDVFAARAQELWHAILERKGGNFAVVARMPFDPSVN